MDLVCHMIPEDHVNQGLCDFMGRNRSPQPVAIGLVQVNI